ncbi:UNVERIFIED_CONTAM: hypothetical protein PYX00_009432 [Menopon gallinae]|uniref:Acylglycerol kinase, mitochondrial n=1 Tax=Menopon gallinae TaxID=328185 RepID=A0AAW2HBA1_9NEOP
MARVSRFFEVLRRNWKKSLFGVAVLGYGVNYGKNIYETKQLMREYCTLASKYGDVPNPKLRRPRQITVILNPAANKRKAKELFEKYCAPLLNLAGLAVIVVQTEYAGHAKEIIDSLDPKTEAIVVAGGDGTVSEIITGLLRRIEDQSGALKKLPMGVLPLGRSNSISLALLGNREEVRALADATMAIIDGSLKTADVIKIEPIDAEGTSKPIYSLAQVEWGAFRDAQSKRDNYWVFGGLRDYVSYLFTNAQDDTWKAIYYEPCKGCSKCRVKNKENWKWWSFFIPRTRTPEKDYSNIINENCGEPREKEFSSVEFAIQTSILSKENDEALDAPHLRMTIGADNLGKFAFVREGWSRLWGIDSKPVETVNMRQIQLMKYGPKKEDDWLSIDNEDFEVRPIKISILPETINLFIPRASGYV